MKLCQLHILVKQQLARVINSSTKLNDDLLVPDIITGLLSISKLTTNCPLIFEFDGSGFSFVIKDIITDWIVASSERKETKGPIYF